MNSIKFILTAGFVALSLIPFAQTNQKTDTINVYGACGMCKNRIERTLKIEGISSATWDVETKLLTVNYDPAKIPNEEIQKKLAAVGHDTEKFRADDDVYKKLPGCCQYERKKEPEIKISKQDR